MDNNRFNSLYFYGYAVHDLLLFTRATKLRSIATVQVSDTTEGE